MMLGTGEKMARVRDLIERVAGTDVTVLIRGESGTGKELVARALHAGSPRRDKPFVKVNCAALPAELLESELFGFERGAFTGALHAKPGKFEFAHHGTIFLDEIAEMSPALQAKLLQVLQDGEFSRLGGKADVRVDVRIITATNRDLERAVAQGQFREDLFFRLNVVSITLPPLRERKDEIPLLTVYFLYKHQTACGRSLSLSDLSDKMMNALMEYSWPGNIRELENVLQQAIIVSHDGVLDLSSFVGESMQVETSARTPPSGSRSLVDVERDHIQLVLETVGWRIEGVAGAAQVLGLRPSTLRTRMRKLGIQRPPKPQALQT